MSLLLGLDAGGARHVDPARLPSSHQGQKIHRLLLGIPCPGNPPGTARYLPKKEPLAPQPCSRAPGPGSWEQAGSCTGKCHRELIQKCPKEAAPTCPACSGRAGPALGLQLHQHQWHSTGQWGTQHWAVPLLTLRPGRKSRGQLALQALLQCRISWLVCPSPPQTPSQGSGNPVSLEAFTELESTGHRSKEDPTMQRAWIWQEMKLLELQTLKT